MENKKLKIIYIGLLAVLLGLYYFGHYYTRYNIHKTINIDNNYQYFQNPLQHASDVIFHYVILSAIILLFIGIYTAVNSHLKKQPSIIVWLAIAINSMFLYNMLASINFMTSLYIKNLW